MCDYSLHAELRRDAVVGDKLIVHRFPTSTYGFTEQGEKRGHRAVCLKVGTELAFDEPVIIKKRSWFFGRTVQRSYTTGKFIELSVDKDFQHYAAVEFPDGSRMKVHHLPNETTATVLQLPNERQLPLSLQARSIPAPDAPALHD